MAEPKQTCTRPAERERSSLGKWPSAPVGRAIGLGRCPIGVTGLVSQPIRGLRQRSYNNKRETYAA